MTTNKTNRTNTAALRIAIAALAVLLVCGAAFAGAAAALTDSKGTVPTSWDSDRSVSPRNYDYEQTVSSNTTIDCGGKNLTITGSAGNGASWFGKVTINSGCTLTIKNLTIKGSVSGVVTTQYTTSYYVGAVIGYLDGGGTLVFDNVTLDGVTITSTYGSYGGNGVGGLVGYARSAASCQFTNCIVKDCTFSGSESVGGLFGLGGASDCQITDCIVERCYIRARESGALVGRGGGTDFQTIDCIVRDCTFSGSADVGGLVGAPSGHYIASGCTVENCSFPGDDDKGGLVGHANAASCQYIDCIVKDCTFSTSGRFGAGGLVGNAEGSCSHVASGCTVENCSFPCDGSGGKIVGGLVGCAYATGFQCTDCIVKDCTISTYGGEAGGLVGHVASSSSASFVASGCTVERCYIYSGVYYVKGVGGLVGWAYSASKTVDLQNCRVADCVLNSKGAGCGGVVGSSTCDSGKTRVYQNNVVSNCVIYGPTAGGIIGTTDTSTETQTCTSNTVEYCTIKSSSNAGGIAGKFPSAGTLGGNTVKNTVVVSLNGAAAGICPLAAA